MVKGQPPGLDPKGVYLDFLRDFQEILKNPPLDNKGSPLDSKGGLLKKSKENP